MRRRLRPLSLALLSGMTSGPASGPAWAQEARRAAPVEAQAVAGAYEVANEAGTRKCILLLRPTEAAGGYAAGFPPQCRVALPPLARVAAWTMQLTHQAPRVRIMLADAAGAVQLDFREEGPNGAAQARDPAGQIYRLAPAQGASLAARADALVGARPAARVIPASPPPDPSAMSRAVGAYALLRPGPRDTGCRIRLDGAGPAATEGAATMTPACEDRGVAFFGPRAWTIVGDTLWLIGARGRIAFERGRRSGEWDKAPGQGEALSLSRR